jgi:hypothetical protein
VDAAMMRRRMDRVVAEIFDGLKQFVERENREAKRP